MKAMPRKFLLVGSSIALLALVGAFVLTPRQPSYQGVKLRDWLDVLFPASGSSDAQKQMAEKAVREIGQDGLPWLIGWLRAKDGRFGKAFAQSMYAPLLPLGISRLWTPAADHKAKAVPAFRILGRAAEPAIPQLLNIATNSTDGAQWMLAVRALCAIGSEKSFDAVMSLASSRSDPLFTERTLRNMFLSINRDMSQYAERNAHGRARQDN
jgi:hypothetical protein